MRSKRTPLVAAIAALLVLGAIAWGCGRDPDPSAVRSSVADAQPTEAEAPRGIPIDAAGAAAPAVASAPRPAAGAARFAARIGAAYLKAVGSGAARERSSLASFGGRAALSQIALWPAKRLPGRGAAVRAGAPLVLVDPDGATVAIVPFVGASVPGALELSIARVGTRWRLIALTPLVGGGR